MTCTVAFSDVDELTQRQHKLLVGNIGWWTCEKDISTALERIGIKDVGTIKIFENRTNGQSLGFCCVSLGTEASLTKIARDLPKTEIRSQVPTVAIFTRDHFFHLLRESGERTHGMKSPLHTDITWYSMDGTRHSYVDGRLPVLSDPGYHDFAQWSTPVSDLAFHMPNVQVPPPNFLREGYYAPVRNAAEESVTSSRSVARKAIRQAMARMMEGRREEATELLSQALQWVESSIASKDERCKILARTLRDTLRALDTTPNGPREGKNVIEGKRRSSDENSGASKNRRRNWSEQDGRRHK